MAKILNDLSWALLGILHRHAQGGPTPPSSSTFDDAYRELEGRGFAEEGHITAAGEVALHTKYS